MWDLRWSLVALSLLTSEHKLRIFALNRAVEPAVVVAECIGSDATTSAKVKAAKLLEHCAICQEY